jgi:hypothetical protein
MTVPLFNNDQRHHVAMIRGGAMAFVALAALIGISSTANMPAPPKRSLIRWPTT